MLIGRPHSLHYGDNVVSTVYVMKDIMVFSLLLFWAPLYHYSDNIYLKIGSGWLSLNVILNHRFLSGKTKLNRMQGESAPHSI